MFEPWYSPYTPLACFTVCSLVFFSTRINSRVFSRDARESTIAEKDADDFQLQR